MRTSALRFVVAVLLPAASNCYAGPPAQHFQTV